MFNLKRYIQPLYKILLKKKKKSVCKFTLTPQQFVEREIQCFSEHELEFAGILQFGKGRHGHWVPLLPHPDTCSPEHSPLGANGVFAFPVCGASNGPMDIYRPTKTLRNACLCCIHAGGFMSAVSQEEIILYGEQSVALGSRATLHKLGTVIFTHQPASDPPALSGSSVAGL